MLVGAGARGTAPLLIEIANLLGAGVAKALLGKDVLPDDRPFVTGAIGLLGTEPSWDLMQDCDTLLMIGTGFPWSEFLPKDGAARHTVAEIETGVRYAVVVTSCAGVWAYLIGDTVTFEKTAPPLLRFSGRTKNFLSAFGEHLIEEEVEKAVASAAHACGVTTTDHHVGPVVLDQFEGIADSVGGRSARRGDGAVGPAEPPRDRDVAAGRVDHQLGNHERRDAVGAAVEEDTVLLFDLVQAADAAAGDNAVAKGISLGEVHSRLADRLVRTVHRELDEAIEPLDLARRDAVARIEIL